ncbi:hypothetical protein [Kingella sp. (in: b-proteobacteria)]|nr:hypothetical protein [Kingella sp. (in: b-proteobacteria)]MDO4656449.1 hypothetical protein [Kingella sp. (in: b-proteobacteria)]
MNRQPENYFAPSNGGLHHVAEQSYAVCQYVGKPPMRHFRLPITPK